MCKCRRVFTYIMETNHVFRVTFSNVKVWFSGLCLLQHLLSWCVKCAGLLLASLQWSEINTGRMKGVMSIYARSKMMKKSH